MSSNSKNQSGYNRWSQFYDTYPNPTVAMDELSFPSFWQHLEGKSILEIGCGTGRHTVKLAKKNKVSGVDLSAGMLAVARERLSGTDAEFFESDFTTYEGFKPAQFDVAICALVVEHISDLPSFFSRLSRVLKSGGEFYLSEIHPDRTARGIAAHFKDPETQEEIWLSSTPHTHEDIVSAANSARLTLAYDRDIVGSPELSTLNAKWERHLGHKLLKIWCFRKQD